jgi:rare lipoprotein A
MLTLVLLMAGCFAGTPTGYASGRASWYGYESARHPMANGQRFNPRKHTAASYNFPLGTELEVTNLHNGRRMHVTVTDRGPAKRLGRLIDLSESSAQFLDYHRAGMTDVSIMVTKYVAGN